MGSQVEIVKQVIVLITRHNYSFLLQIRCPHGDGISIGLSGMHACFFLYRFSVRIAGIFLIAAIK